jgi:hypothetical protein
MRISLPVLTTPSGVVLYHGPSEIDGKKIVVIATGLKEGSENIKTGSMIQTWILKADKTPLKALDDGTDFSVCGDCKHRHFRSCYVNIAQGPRAVYEAFLKGNYPEATGYADSFKGKYVRFGSYGDPAAVPVKVWEQLSRVAAGHTGYTHRWQKADSKLKQFCMASCDTEEEARKARKLGWKPFLVRLPGEALPKGYFECPASKAEGQRLTCQQCMACKGGKLKRAKQGMPSIEAHGPSWKVQYFIRGMKAMRNKKKYIGINDIPTTPGYKGAKVKA